VSDDPLRYPIGRFSRPDHVSAADRAASVAQLAALPATLRASVDGLGAAQLDTPYRDGGWTVRQVVQHLGDSHLNAYARLALGLSEASPVIRVYDENAWVRLGTEAGEPLDDLLAFVDRLHRRFVALARTVDDPRGARDIVHPDRGRFTIDALLALYAWHGAHHVAHITSLRARRGW
jgi:hypothetical protein